MRFIFVVVKLYDTYLTLNNNRTQKKKIIIIRTQQKIDERSFFAISFTVVELIRFKLPRRFVF